MELRDTYAAILGEIHFPDHEFILRADGGVRYLQIVNRKGWWGRRWLLIDGLSTGEVVQTAFLALMTYIEHETRENFTYRAVPVLSPHIDIEALMARHKEPA